VSLKECQLIGEFEHEYQPNEGIHWYFKKSSLAKIGSMISAVLIFAMHFL
jgi:hypothetical protein